jgi:CheY-like chemotaxis protein
VEARSEGDLTVQPSVRRRVLVADDNEDSAETMAMLLEALGHEVKIAHDGLQAVEQTEAFRPEVVLLDIGMPRVDGYEAARRIRAQAWGRSIVLVALTGWGQDEDRRRSEEAGFDRHLIKPVDIEALQQVLAGGA